MSVLDELKVLKSVISFDSTKNDESLDFDNVGEFLIKSLRELFGTEKLKKSVGEMLDKITDKANNTIKESVKKQVENIPEAELSPTFEQVLTLKELDPKGELKEESDSKIGKLLFVDKPGLTKMNIRKAIEAEGTKIDIRSGFIKYNSLNDTITLTPN